MMYSHHFYLHQINLNLCFVEYVINYLLIKKGIKIKLFSMILRLMDRIHIAIIIYSAVSDART